MKFDVVVGNPPYQSETKKLLYPDFYLLGQRMGSLLSMIFPTGWQEPKKNNGLEKMNTIEIKSDCQIVHINNIHNAFPSVKGVEWANIILWKKDFDNQLKGKQRVFINGKDEKEIKLLVDKSEIKKPDEIIQLGNLIKNNPDFESVKNITTTRKPYGLATDAYQNYKKYNIPKMQKERQKEDDIKVYDSVHNYVYVPKDYPFPRQSGNLKNYKVLVPDAWGNLSNAGLGGAYAK